MVKDLTQMVASEMEQIMAESEAVRNFQAINEDTVGSVEFDNGIRQAGRQARVSNMAVDVWPGHLPSGTNY